MTKTLTVGIPPLHVQLSRGLTVPISGKGLSCPSPSPVLQWQPLPFPHCETPCKHAHPSLKETIDNIRRRRSCRQRFDKLTLTVSRPSPEFPPVTTTTLPVRSGMSLGNQEGLPSQYDSVITFSPLRKAAIIGEWNKKDQGHDDQRFLSI
jgi:hypothetical protein